MVVMNAYEQMTLNLLEKHGGISVPFLCRKLKITEMAAEKLCDWAYRNQAETWFRIRNCINSEDI